VQPSHVRPARYAALGDSYTIGTAVDAGDRWPDQLVARLGERGIGLDLVANLAVNGATSLDVIERQLPAVAGIRPEFVSLLVGVNDVVRGVPAASFEANVVTILDSLLARLGPHRILVVTTPDYTVTPEGATYGDPVTQRAAIVRNNGILHALATAQEIVVVDIFDLSARAAGDLTLIAEDGLHPSGAQYRLWVERIQPVVEGLLLG
jgi:lysophospholipase L1-like esterase